MTFTDGEILYAADLESRLGDTGWVSMQSLGSGWTATYAKVRRVGAVVELVVDTLVRSSGTATIALIIPDGFRPTNNAARWPRIHTGAGTAATNSFLTPQGELVISAPVNGTAYYISHMWSV